MAETLTSPGKITGIKVTPGDNEAVKQAVYDATGGAGAEVVIECSGNAHACALTPELACPGGTLVFVGCPTPVTMDIGLMQVRCVAGESPLMIPPKSK